MGSFSLALTEMAKILRGFLQILLLFSPTGLSNESDRNLSVDYEFYNEYFRHDEQPEWRSQENVRKMQLVEKETHSPEVKRIVHHIETMNIEGVHRTHKHGENFPEILIFSFIGIIAAVMMVLLCLGSKKCVDRFLDGRQKIKKALQYRPQSRSSLSPSPQVTVSPPSKEVNKNKDVDADMRAIYNIA